MTGKKQKMEGYKHYCPICGKEFWAFADWEYRLKEKGIRNKVYYCSWRCKRKREKERMMNMEEKIMIEFTGEEMDKIQRYQKIMIHEFPKMKDKTIQELIMMAIDRQLLMPKEVI